jgi:hypothetical protein
MQIKAIFLSLALSASLASAQGTYHFEWHGNQSEIHGGFDVTYDEVNALGKAWGSQLLLDSLSFTDFTGVLMNTLVQLREIWPVGKRHIGSHIV